MRPLERRLSSRPGEIEIKMGAAGGKRKNWNQPSSIRDYKTKESEDSSAQGERPGD